MSGATQATLTLVEQARAAAGRGEWQRAYDLLVEADAGTPLRGPDLPLLAEAGYAVGRLDVTITAWERAHAQSVRAGDRLAAAGAAVRVALHLLIDTALMAPIRGWTTRAERLLAGHAETPVHAWLAVVRGYERLLSGDFRSARRWAGGPAWWAASAAGPRTRKRRSPRPVASPCRPPPAARAHPRTAGAGRRRRGGRPRRLRRPSGARLGP